MAMRLFCIGMLGALLPVAAWAAKDEPAKAPAAPPASFTLLARHGHVTPTRTGFTHTGGGNIDVQQPTPDAIVVTMTGVAVAGGHPCKCSAATLDFDLQQIFEVNFEKTDLKAAKITIEARVIGLLRSEAKGSGSAEEADGCATIGGENGEVLTVCAPSHSVAGGESLSINDRDGPTSVTISKAGKFTLHETFHLAASHAKSMLGGKAASAEFAPDPALDPLWISYWEPFHGASKKDFGFQVTIKIAEDSPPEPAKK